MQLTHDSPSAPLTPQQATAVSCRQVSVVLASGAGCGKTHVLTERYLAHLRDDGAEVSQLVAITFTDRAARQMRERIRRAILAHLRGTGAAAEGERWARHLRGLETAQISTIHAFCAALLRQHAVDAGLDPRFDVLEDVLSVNLEAESLTGCLQRLLTESSVAGEDLRHLIYVYGWQPVVGAIQELVRERAQSLWEPWRQRPAAEIAAQWQTYARTSLLPRYLEYLSVASPKIARCLWQIRQTPPRPGSKAAANVAALLEGMARLAQADDLAAAIEQLKEAAKVGREGAKVWPSEEAYETIKTVFEDFRDELGGPRLKRLALPPENLAASVDVGQRFLCVAGEAARAYRELKHLRGVVDFQDLLVLARDLLRDHPEVRERLQRRSRYLLIDELQDTDPVQMELVEHLCGEGLTMGKLFAVGDASQSIYRFRGANVHLFRGLRHQVPQEGRLGLTVNFRSQPAILDFTNVLLGHRLSDYEPLIAHHPQLNPGPCVEFLWSPRGDKENVSEARSREADWIARRIVHMIDREALVAQRTAAGQSLRSVRPGDVVLLFRSMTQVQIYEAALRRHGLNYYLVGGRAFFAQQEIYDLLNLLRALENPHDAVSLAGTLRSPFCCLSDEALFYLGRHPEGLWAGLHDRATALRLPRDQQAVADRARRFLDRWRNLKDRLPIARLLGEVFADSGYDAATQFEFLADRKLANLWKLVDLARTFDRSGLFGLAEFMQRLGDLVRTQPREEQAATQPENADVVRLMSIHQAKGLEFPVVFIPDLAATAGGSHHPVGRWDAELGCVVRPPADEEPAPFPDFGWELWKAQEAIEDWHEDLRTLYVACTRAQDYLVLSAALRQPVSPANTWMLTLAERFDLRSGRCLVPELAADRVPSVRVTDERAAPPDPSGPPGADEKRRFVWSAVAEPASDGPEVLARVAPVPCRRTGQRVYTVAELEELLRRKARPAQRLEVPAEDVDRFGAEDGSDRHAWVPPRQRIEGGGESSGDPRERLVRAALGQWDFQAPDGWRPGLAQAVQSPAWSGAGPDTQAEVERLLARFAQSNTYRLLQAARVCYKEVEFVLEVNAEEPQVDLPGDGPRPLVRGILDCLWQDTRAAWHLLAYTLAPVGPAARPRYWNRHRTGLMLGAWALARRLGTWPESITLFFLEDGTALTRRGRSLRDRKLVARIEAVFDQLKNGAPVRGTQA